MDIIKSSYILEEGEYQTLSIPCTSSVYPVQTHWHKFSFDEINASPNTETH